MSRGPVLTLAITISLVLLPVALSARRYANTRNELDLASLSLSSLAHDAQRVENLRVRQQRVAVSTRPQNDLIASVKAALGSADVPDQHFSGLEPDSDVPVRGAHAGQINYRRQSVRLSLRQITPEQLGRFLGSWRALEHLWVPARIDLTHAGGRNAANTYDATIVVSAVYIGDGES